MVTPGDRGGIGREAAQAAPATFCLVGLLADEVTELSTLFERAEPEVLRARLLEEAGFPWAHAFDIAWQQDPAEARTRGLFDLLWHQRALERDPMMTAPDYSGFNVLLEAISQVEPGLAQLLSHIDACRTDNPRRRAGPGWWQAWHAGTATTPCGWLDLDEVRAVHEIWPRIAVPELEEACLTALGATYTHPGCWRLLADLGGFFAQCACEQRVVIAELDS